MSLVYLNSKWLFNIEICSNCKFQTRLVHQFLKNFKICLYDMLKIIIFLYLLIFNLPKKQSHLIFVHIYMTLMYLENICLSNIEMCINFKFYSRKDHILIEPPDLLLRHVKNHYFSYSRIFMISKKERKFVIYQIFIAWNKKNQILILSNSNLIK